MVSTRRLVSLVLTSSLFVVCLVLSSHTPTLAQGKGPKKHPVMHKALDDLHDAHKRMKAAKGNFNGHRTKALKHIDEAMDEIKKAIKHANEAAAK